MTGGAAYWISPTGKVTSVTASHIAEVIADPASFKMRTAEIERVYVEHGEPIGHEGEARRVILQEILAKGWIRLRRHRDRWSVEADEVTPQVKTYLCAWGKQIRRRNIEADGYVPVDVVGLSDGFRQRVEVRRQASAFRVEGGERWRLRWG